MYLPSGAIRNCLRFSRRIPEPVNDCWEELLEKDVRLELVFQC